MYYTETMKKVITHSGPFHADDVFAVATLQLHLGLENIELIRTRDEVIIATGDIVLDVGGVYDPERQRFDHHQVGAPVRDNGVPYAAFGLIWKHFGSKVTGSASVADTIEKSLVWSIDASDNGVSVYNLTELEIKPTTISDIVSLFNPMEGTAADIDAAFLSATALAREILLKSIDRAKNKEVMKQTANAVYEASANKSLLVFEVPMTKSLLIDYPDVKLMVSPDYPASSTNWLATAIPKTHGSFELRTRFPEEWGGLRGEELEKVSGIPGAIFCHRAGFLFVAKDRDGALAAVNKVLGQ